MGKQASIIIFGIILLSCHTPENVIRKDIRIFLRQKYKKEFRIKNVKLLSNEGNAFADNHRVLYHPEGDPDSLFQIGIRYKKKAIVFYGDGYAEKSTKFKLIEEHLHQLVYEYADKYHLELSIDPSVTFNGRKDLLNYQWLEQNYYSDFYLNLILYYDMESSKGKTLKLLSKYVRFLQPKAQSIQFFIIYPKKNHYDTESFFGLDFSNKVDYTWKISLDKNLISKFDGNPNYFEPLIQVRIVDSGE